MSYKGDTHGKRMARANFWLRMRDYFGADWTSIRIAYLASQQGGDAMALEALGHPAHLQLAVEIDERRMAQFKEKFPGVPTYLGDIARLAHHEKFDVIFLDSCRNVNARLVLECQACVRHVRHRGVFAVGFQRGREAKEVLEKVEARRAALVGAHNELWTKQFGDAPKPSVQMPYGGDMTYKQALGVVERQWCGRSSVLHDAIYEQGERDMFIPHSLAGINYQSAVVGHIGTPMRIMANWVNRAPKSMTRLRYPKWCMAERGIARFFMLAKARLWQEGVTMGAPTPPPQLVALWPSWSRMWNMMKSVLNVHSDFTGVDSSRHLVAFASGILSLNSNINAAKLLALTSGRLAALKAHYTMGTYGPALKRIHDFSPRSSGAGFTQQWWYQMAQGMVSQ